MSQRAARAVPMTDGNTARSLSAAEFLPGLPQPRKVAKPVRPALSLVAFTPRKNRTPIIMLFLLLFGALAAVLIMSVSVSQGQYQIVELKAQQSQLANENQAHELALASNEAPQNLVARAVAMGMVPAGSTGQIDVRTQKVTGNPTPASADTKGLVTIPSAEVNKSAPVVVDSPAAVAAAAAAADPAAPAAPAAPVAPVAPAPELNGGTIPAPAQKTN